MLAQGDASGDQSVVEWIKAFLKERDQKPGNVYLGLLHRLDRPTGGVLLLAKTSKAASRLSKQFQNREVAKTYWLLTQKRLPESRGELIHYLKQLPGKKNIMKAFPRQVADSKKAHLSYQILSRKGGRALVSVDLHTGRKHQIRVQMAAVGAPIQGDVKYGAASFNPDKSICLWARSLEITHPTLQEKIIFEAPLPPGKLWSPFNQS